MRVKKMIPDSTWRKVVGCPSPSVDIVAGTSESEWGGGVDEEDDDSTLKLLSDGVVFGYRPKTKMIILQSKWFTCCASTSISQYLELNMHLTLRPY